MPRYRVSFPMDLLFTVDGKDENEAMQEARRLIGENFIDGQDLAMHPFVPREHEPRLYFSDCDEDGIEFTDEYPDPMPLEDEEPPVQDYDSYYKPPY